MKHVPNILSSSRFLLAASLPFLAKRSVSRDNSILFLIIFLIAMATDLFDGLIARKYNVVSAFGTRLDSLSDTAVFVACFFSLFFIMKPEFNLIKTVLTGCVGILFMFFCYVYSRVKFKQWVIMHTYGGKFMGVLLYAFVPIIVLSGKVYYGYVVVATVITVIASIEILVACAKMEEFDGDFKGFLFQKLTIDA